MSFDRLRILEDLLVFADLTTEPRHHGDPLVVRMFRQGEELELRFHDDGAGKVIERSLETGESRSHASYRALLASERWGNLRAWLGHQKIALQQALDDIKPPIPVTGSLPNSDAPIDIKKLDDRLATHDHGGQSVHVMLIDGPAGIGKTTFISLLALSRAETYLTHRRPLVLHVQSRGRVLTYLQDMIAFSLQKLRLAVTFDQLPVLVRHGLVTLAIDGFDELADPNGYDIAWSQINELVDQVRGRGTLILAGRETFIGLERIKDRVKSLTEQDTVDVLSLQPPDPAMAKNWLRKKNWTDEDLRSSEALFEPDSYALRPFFLAQLAVPETASNIGKKAAGNLLGLLVESMIDREAGKFGDAVATVLNEDERRDYLRHLLREIARSMADDGTEAIDEQMLAWLVDVAAPEGMPPDVIGLLKHRTPIVAFMEKDDAPNYRRFAHSQIYHHFLGLETIDAIVKGEIPKYVRRNIMGADFLAAFSDLVVAVAEKDPKRIRKFFSPASHMVEHYAWIDQGVRNLGAFLVTMLPAMKEIPDLKLQGLDIDEATIQGTAPPAEVQQVTVNQLDVRGADLRELNFDSTTIVTLVVDEATLVPASLPVPMRLQYAGHSAQSSAVIANPAEIKDWLGKHGMGGPGDDEDHGLVPSALRDHSLLRLLGRVCRRKSYWIPLEKRAKFQTDVDDPYWNVLFELLADHDLVRLEQKAVSGKGTELVHIKRSKDILTENSKDDQIRAFYESLVERLKEESP